MNIEQIREYCLTLPGTTESFPFNETTLVFKVKGKMFALMSLEGDSAVSLKCDPERGMELRELYPEVRPGYHMNKAMWNTVFFAGNLPSALVFSMIRDSYSLVVAGLSRKLRNELEQGIF